jgi:hypothetical protein
VPIVVDIDYARFDGSGRTEGSSVFVTDVSTDFVEKMMEGSAIALFNAEGRRLITFSLSGSKAAVLKWIECYGLISATPGADPFAAPGADPFASNYSDPF